MNANVLALIVQTAVEMGLVVQHTANDITVLFDESEMEAAGMLVQAAPALRFVYGPVLTAYPEAHMGYHEGELQAIGFATKGVRGDELRDCIEKMKTHFKPEAVMPLFTFLGLLNRNAANH